MQAQIGALRDLVEKRKALTGGKWVTINGTHVYIRKGGKIVAGPSGVKKSKAAKKKGGKVQKDEPPKKPRKKKAAKAAPKKRTKKKEGLLAKLKKLLKAVAGKVTGTEVPSAKKLKGMKPDELRSLAKNLRKEAEKIRAKREG